MFSCVSLRIVPPVLLRCTFPHVFRQAVFTPRMHASAVLHSTAGLLFNSPSFSSLTCSYHSPGTVLLFLLVLPVSFYYISYFLGFVIPLRSSFCDSFSYSIN